MVLLSIISLLYNWPVLVIFILPEFSICSLAYILPFLSIVAEVLYNSFTWSAVNIVVYILKSEILAVAA